MSAWVHAHYLTLIRTERLQKAITRAVAVLKNYEFDSIAFRGLSGALVGPPLALALNKHMIAVRKNEKRHSVHPVEGYAACERYVIVDDFKCSGTTGREIVESIKEFAPQAVCLGLLEVTKLSRKKTLVPTHTFV